MVIIEPNPLTRPFEPWHPEPEPSTLPIGTYTVEKIKEVIKKWKEKHIKDVKKGILITFEDDEEPIFIATDDKCFQKILDAIKDEPKKHK